MQSDFLGNWKKRGGVGIAHPRKLDLSYLAFTLREKPQDWEGWVESPRKFQEEHKVNLRLSIPHLDTHPKEMNPCIKTRPLNVLAGRLGDTTLMYFHHRTNITWPQRRTCWCMLGHTQILRSILLNARNKDWIISFMQNVHNKQIHRERKGDWLKMTWRVDNGGKSRQRFFEGEQVKQWSSVCAGLHRIYRLRAQRAGSDCSQLVLGLESSTETPHTPNLLGTQRPLVCGGGWWGAPGGALSYKYEHQSSQSTHTQEAQCYFWQGVGEREPALIFYSQTAYFLPELVIHFRIPAWLNSSH